MLRIYEKINGFPNFCEMVYKDIYNEELKFNKIQIDYDVFLLDLEVYTVDDINDYTDFFKYKAMNLSQKLAIINNFDKVNIKIQNKLLKLFEESDDNHILTVNNKAKVLPTILSRGTIYEATLPNEINYENYPKRYKQILEIINESDEAVIDNYLKFYNKVVQHKFSEAYIHISLLKQYDVQKIYEIIQYAARESKVKSDLLMLQQRLITKTNLNLQIENYLLEMMEENGSNK